MKVDDFYDMLPRESSGIKLRGFMSWRI